jgi:ribonuclease VapC
MVVDASAILAVLLGEEDAGSYAEALASVEKSCMSAVNYWEVLVRIQVLEVEMGLASAATVIERSEIEVVAADAELARAAASAFARYRGRPARLNLGDCFAYALAMREGDGLLYKGNDFPKTDVKSALDT